MNPSYLIPHPSSLIPRPSPLLPSIPLNSEFTIFAGLEDVLRFLNIFRFSKEDISALKKKFPRWDDRFWDYLATIDASQIKVYAIQEGTVVFPRVPLLRVEGPLGVCQLLETTLLVLINFASLITTNAARHRLAVGPSKTLLEFGLRRAQGPDGAMTASRYAYVGGFDGTSNVKAGVLYSLALSGTHAHSFVSSFSSLDDLRSTKLADPNTGEEKEFVQLALKYRQELGARNTNTGELAAFIAYAQAFPDSFLALIDTYDTLESGILNFLAVSLALNTLGYRPRGIRLDSGDLAYLSKRCRQAFVEVSRAFGVEFERLLIVASNDLDESVLWSLKEQGHEIDSFGIGTNLVTCSAQPALGCVFKLVELNGEPRIKISQDHAKVTIPGKKRCYRLYNSKGEPVVDLLTHVTESSEDEGKTKSPSDREDGRKNGGNSDGRSSPFSGMVRGFRNGEGAKVPIVGERILCRHPFDSNKRAFVTPSRVEDLHHLVWDGKIVGEFPTLHKIRERVLYQLAHFREDHLRHLNPTPYKVSLSSDLFTFMHDLWQQEVPVMEIF